MARRRTSGALLLMRLRLEMMSWGLKDELRFERSVEALNDQSRLGTISRGLERSVEALEKESRLEKMDA